MHLIIIYSKNWDASNNFHSCPKMFGLFGAVMHFKDADGLTDSVDPDQTAPKGQSDLGLHCLPRSVCPKT